MFGRRYIVADLTQKSLDLTTRLDVALSPSLSMQLYAQPFVSSGDYSAFTLIRNTTSSDLHYTVNWRDGAGSIVGTIRGTLAGNGSAFVNARDVAGALAAGHGTIEIAHDSSPDAVVATTTVLSATTGLSFDTVFAKRATW